METFLVKCSLVYYFIYFDLLYFLIYSFIFFGVGWGGVGGVWRGGESSKRL